MENDVIHFWGANIFDEEELSPEECAQLPWNDPADFPGERPYDVEESLMSLPRIVEEDWGYEEENRPKHEEEPDINLIYGLYEESEFY